MGQVAMCCSHIPSIGLRCVYLASLFCTACGDFSPVLETWSSHDSARDGEGESRHIQPLATLIRNRGRRVLKIDTGAASFAAPRSSSSPPRRSRQNGSRCVRLRCPLHGNSLEGSPRLYISFPCFFPWFPSATRPQRIPRRPASRGRVSFHS